MQKNVSDRLSCPKCGRVVRWNDAYCSACGSKIELTEDASISLPKLSRSISISELWGKKPKATSNVETEAQDLSSAFPLVREGNQLDSDSSILQEDEQLDADSSPLQEEARLDADSSLLQEDEKSDDERFLQNGVSVSNEFSDETQSKYRCNYPKLSFGLFVSVLLELFAFIPYGFVVLCVFKYNVFCDVLAILGTVALLTHGVCVCASYVVALVHARKNKYEEVMKDMDIFRRLLRAGAILFSILLLAFVICLVYNDSAALPPKAADKYTPVSFDD